MWVYIKTAFCHGVFSGSRGPQSRQPEAQGWKCRPYSSHQQTFQMSWKNLRGEKYYRISLLVQLRRHKPGRDTASNTCTAHFNSNWKNILSFRVIACVWAFMIWQIYCITSWTAPPVDWQDVPVHIHFYIKFLLYFFFKLEYFMCFASAILCIKKSILRLKAMHSAS